MQRETGTFVAIDGPKSVGKTTILPHIEAWLVAHGLSVLLTKEPTPRFSLDTEQQYAGLALARLLSDDRRAHLAEIIEPALTTHDVVITDRYIASTIAFRLLDTVPIVEVWDLNRNFRLPDLNVFLLASPEVLSNRRSRRAAHSRFERGDPRKEVEAYHSVQAFLRNQGTKTVVVDNSRDGEIAQAAQAIAAAIARAAGGQGD